MRHHGWRRSGGHNGCHHQSASAFACFQVAQDADADASLAARSGEMAKGDSKFATLTPPSSQALNRLRLSLLKSWRIDHDEPAEKRGAQTTSTTPSTRLDSLPFYDERSTFLAALAPCNAPSPILHVPERWPNCECSQRYHSPRHD